MSWVKVEGIQGVNITTHCYEVTAEVDGSIVDSDPIDIDGLLMAVTVDLDDTTPPNSITPVLKRQTGSALPIAGTALTATAEEIKPDNDASFVLITNGIILSGSGNTTPSAKAVYKLHMLNNN